VLDRLKRVKKEFTAPFISSNDLNLEQGSEESMNRLLLSLEETIGIEPIAMLKKLTAAWLRNRLEVLNVPMPPRNVQSITFLLLARWLSDHNACNKVSSIFAQVGTGEGKSLAIAMLAVYAVKAGKKVHVLENNKGLLDRDYDTFESFYKSMGCSTSRDYDSEADICYVLRSHLEHAYRDRVFEGYVPAFPDTVIIVDEVDELIVDGSPNSNYVKADSDFSGFSKAITAILNGQQAKPAEIDEKIWSRAKKSYNEASSKVKNKDYKVDNVGRKIIVLDSKGGHLSYTYEWQRVLAQQHGFGDATIMTCFFWQNMTHMFCQYSSIVGLSGSLGSPAEKKYLMETYNADVMYVPSFLDTCDDAQKCKPKLISNRVTIRRNQPDQIRDVIALAIKKKEEVPVVIICRSAHVARHVHANLERKKVETQLLLEHGADSKHMNYKTIVDRATHPVETNGTNTWRITVTDYFGGRGQDYRINDEDVDRSGGLLVIAMSIPESEREFIQWKGRTARGDRQGQWALILNLEDTPLKENEDKWLQHGDSAANGAANNDTYTGHIFKKAVVDSLLSLADEDVKKKLESMKRDIKVGQRLNELCDKFYKKHGSGNGVWPNGPEQRALRDFLKENDHNVSMDAVAKFAMKVKLVTSVAMWKRESAY
jgi:hypothetical protein